MRRLRVSTRDKHLSNFKNLSANKNTHTKVSFTIIIASFFLSTQQLGRLKNPKVQLIHYHIEKKQPFVLKQSTTLTKIVKTHRREDADKTWRISQLGIKKGENPKDHRNNKLKEHTTTKQKRKEKKRNKN